MPEEQTQVSVANGESASGEVGASQQASETGDAPGAVEISPETQVLIDTAVAEEREAMQEKYEGSGGKIAKIQSKYDTMLAQRDRRLLEAQQARIQEAQALAQEDPERAGQMLEEQAKAMAEQQSSASQAEQIREWVQRKYEGVGISLEDDENAQQAAQDYENLIGKVTTNPEMGQALAAEFVNELSGRAVKQARADTSAIAKDFTKFKESVPDMVRTEVARALSQSGESTPDLTTPGKPTGSRKDYSRLSATANIAAGLKKRQEDAAKKK